ncbi:tyrosine-type recombinase/integrase [Clostridium butyricum]|uniref:tyrosine-type recombinase/integrase n=1 Tax=Clostridium butyricum TaxID=1492 RepID=UPI0032BF54C1
MRKRMIKINEKDKNFEDGYQEFLNNCKVRNLRPATIEHYESIVNYIWYKFYNPKDSIKDITLSTVEEFIVFCKQERKQKDVTVNTNLRAIRTILYFFMKKGYMQEFKIGQIKQDQEIIETYTEEEIRILLKKPNLNKCIFTEYRDWVICNLMLSAGTRASTIVNMKREDVDLTNAVIYYRHTKNRKQQVVPISRTLQVVLREYLSYIEDEEYLFPNTYGGKLQTRSLTHTLMYYNRRRGVEKTGVHRWRHTFAKNWILNGGDIFRLQKILGHSDMTIVRNYVNMFTDDLKTDFNEFNPLESIQKNERKSIKLTNKRKK